MTPQELEFWAPLLTALFYFIVGSIVIFGCLFVYKARRRGGR